MYSTTIQGRLLRFGYQFLGPFLTDWYNRLAIRTAEVGVGSDTIFMLGREGWNLVPLFNTLETCRPVARPRRFVYLQISRALLTHISLGDPRFAGFGFATTYTGSVQDFFESRLGVPIELLELPPVADQVVVLPRDAFYLQHLLSRGRLDVEALAARSRAAYDRYLQGVGFRPGATHMLADLGFRGTSQALLTALFGYATVGFYALLDPCPTPAAPPLPPGSMHGLFSDSRSFGSGYPPLDHSLLLEIMLTAPFGQVIGIQDTPHGDPFLYRPGGVAQQNFGVIAECMQGALKFAMDNIDLLGSREPLIDDLELFFEAYRDAIVDDVELFRPILTVDDSYYGTNALNAESKL